MLLACRPIAPNVKVTVDVWYAGWPYVSVTSGAEPSSRFGRCLAAMIGSLCDHEAQTSSTGLNWRTTFYMSAADP